MTIKFLDGAYVGIVCNVCGTDAPDRAAITAAHGLSRLGWRIDGGVHLCPEHVDEKVAPSSPIYEVSGG
jgi:hypothetical protein